MIQYKPSSRNEIQKLHIGWERAAWSVTNCDSSPTATPAEMRTTGAPLLLCLQSSVQCLSTVLTSMDSNVALIGA